jgi:hypothetical protein
MSEEKTAKYNQGEVGDILELTEVQAQNLLHKVEPVVEESKPKPKAKAKTKADK